MRLERLTLENFRGFETLDLEFHPRLTVLVGVNGSGKTSILHAVVAVLHNAYGGSLGDITEWDDRRLGQPGFSIRLATAEPHVEGQLGSRFDVRTRETDDLARALRDDPIGVCAYPVRRRVDTRRFGHLESVADPDEVSIDVFPLASQWQGSSDASEFFAWFLRQENIENEYRRDDPSHRDPILETTRRAVENLMPGYGSLRVRRAHSMVPRFTLTKNGEEFDFARLSEGEQVIASLVGDIARRTADPKTRRNRGIVLVDEIDLHLHPQWQANVLPALLRTFPEVQFVVTTHSPIVLSHVDTQCVRLLEDFRLVEVPPTSGRDPNSVLTDVFGVPLRPAKTQAQLDHIAELIDAERLDEAKGEIQRLSAQLGPRDIEVTRLRGLVELMEV